MTNSPESLTDRELARLVDGELSAAEYRDVLRRLEAASTTSDEHASPWRRCAILFLEQQAWQQDLRRLWSEPCERAEVDDWKVDEAEPSTGQLPCANRCDSVVPAKRQPQTRDPSWQLVPTAIAERSPQVPSLARHCQRWRAATLLLGALCVLLLTRDWATTAPVTQTPGAATRRVSGGLTDRARPAAGTRDSRQTWTNEVVWLAPQAVPTADGSYDLPLYHLSDQAAQQALRAASSLPDEWVESWRRQGREVRRRWQYSTLRLPDGRGAVIPIEQVELIPVSTSAIP